MGHRITQVACYRNTMLSSDLSISKAICSSNSLTSALWSRVINIQQHFHSLLNPCYVRISRPGIHNQCTSDDGYVKGCVGRVFFFCQLRGRRALSL